VDAGEGDYRSYVGPADQYDLIGAAQFALLYALGLREHHRLLDIGCGSLRAGRMLIPYLGPGLYTGVEPNGWLIDAAVERELGEDILRVKRPRFDSSADFSLGHLGRFDFVLAQGVATNTGPVLLRRLLQAIAATLDSTGLAAVTFVHPGSGDTEAVHVSLHDPDVPGWRYPGCYSYDQVEIASAITDANLIGQSIPWFHPRHQWWLLTRSEAATPPNAFTSLLSGVTVAEAFRASWQA
jgi:SAM-dependent methyltransferase